VVLDTPALEDDKVADRVVIGHGTAHQDVYKATTGADLLQNVLALLGGHMKWLTNHKRSNHEDPV
jgi:hypothetical protein